MEALLRWGIENSATDGQRQPLQPRTDIDTSIIDHILGKSDSVLMQEALAVAVDGERSEDERVGALDDLEMLIENIDNANNLEKLDMWKPLQKLLLSPSSPDPIKTQTLWVIGTAVQNNPSAQNAYLSITPLPSLIEFLSPSGNSHQTRSKAVYALSGLLKHNSAAVEALDNADGWAALRSALEDSNITVRRKTVFLINTLLMPTSLDAQRRTSGDSSIHSTPVAPVHPNSHASMLSDPSSSETSPATMKALREHGLLAALISALTAPTPHGEDGESEGDANFEETVVRLLHTFALVCKGQFSAEEKQRLSRFFDQQLKMTGGKASLCERWGISEEDMDALNDHIHS